MRAIFLCTQRMTRHAYVMWESQKIRVMISSTVKDLEPEREAVEQAIREFRFDRFRSESMGSTGLTPQEVCEQAARECDILVLILGYRYGWVIPALNVSVTEREWQVARAADRTKVLVYVKDDPNNLREPQQRGFLEKATDFTSGHFRSQAFRDVRTLRKQVKNDISGWISQRIAGANMTPRTVMSLPSRGDAAFRVGMMLFMSIGMATALALSPSLLVGAEGKLDWNNLIRTFVQFGVAVRQEGPSSFGLIVGLVTCTWLITIGVALGFYKANAQSVRLDHSVIGPFLWAAALVLFLFGPWYFGFHSHYEIYTALLAGVAFCWSGLRRDLLAILSDVDDGQRSLSEATCRLAICPVFPQSTILIATLYFADGTIYSRPHNLASDFRDRWMVFDQGGAVGTALAFLVLVVLVWGLARWIQAWLGETVFKNILGRP